MKAKIIQVPYMCGDDGQGASRGPMRFLEAGADKVLIGKGIDVEIESIDLGKPFLDSVSASLAINKKLAASVSRSVEEDGFALVLAGSCDASIGIMGGLGDTERGVVWFDAHGDYNTPDTTLTGFFGGMPVAVWTGDCYPYFWGQVAERNPVAQDAVVMVGLRDIDTLERERFVRSDITVVEWQDGRPQGDLDAALDDLAKRVDEVYVHIDMDSLDPQVSPGYPQFMAAGGMTVEQLEDAIKAIGSRFRIRVATVATFNPEFDTEGKALKSGLRLIAALAEAAARA